MHMLMYTERKQRLSGHMHPYSMEQFKWLVFFICITQPYNLLKETELTKNAEDMHIKKGEK